MKKIFSILLLFVILISCANDDDNNSGVLDLIGEWRLIEIYSDPGNGSGDFAAVESEMVMTFNENGTVVTNSDLCFFPGDIIEGTVFEYDYDNTASSIAVDECEFFDPIIALGYVIDDERNLILAYPCIETCLIKFQKTTN